MSLIFSIGFPTGMEGLTYPIPFSDPEALVQIAQHAEALGYHSVWGNDHMTTQHYVRAEFPGAASFLGAAGHLRFSCCAHEDASFRHGRAGAADASRYRSDCEADRHA